MNLLTMEVAAKRLGISQKTLLGHVKDGAITYIALGRGLTRVRRMFTEADLNAFIEKRRHTDFSAPTIRRRRNPSNTNAEPFDFTALREQRRIEKQNRLKS